MLRHGVTASSKGAMRRSISCPTQRFPFREEFLEQKSGTRAHDLEKPTAEGPTADPESSRRRLRQVQPVTPGCSCPRLQSHAKIFPTVERKGTRSNLVGQGWHSGHCGEQHQTWRDRKLDPVLNRDIRKLASYRFLKSSVCSKPDDKPEIRLRVWFG